MSIILKPEQEQVLREAIKFGLAQTADEALNQTLAALREQIPRAAPIDPAVAASRTASGPSASGTAFHSSAMTIKELLRRSRA